MGASETLAEHRERKRLAAIRYANAQQKYIKRVFDEKHLPQLTRVLMGICTGIDTNAKTITVRFDPLARDLTIPTSPNVLWDRPQLPASTVVGKRVKVLVSYTNDNTTLILGAITTE